MGVMLTSGYGGLNLAELSANPTMSADSNKHGSMYPAQIRVNDWWHCEKSLSGPSLFEIIGRNLKHNGGSPSNSRVNQKDVDCALDADQVHLSNPSPREI